MIHYFNPEHESALLHATTSYRPTAIQVRMQRELAFLPAWYASPGHYVWVEEDLDNAFRQQIRPLHLGVEALSVNNVSDHAPSLRGKTITPWGLSPAALHRMETIGRKHRLDWHVPRWNDVWRTLAARPTAAGLLAELIRDLPALSDIVVPTFLSRREDLEVWAAQHPGAWLVKSPYSSSGRGLVQLPAPGATAQSEWNIISGMLKRQAQVSVEPLLDKVMDFSLHCTLAPGQPIRPVGHSLFRTNERGAYQASYIASPIVIGQQIYTHIDPAQLTAIENHLLPLLHARYAPHYHGPLGIDMLIYKTPHGAHLHPCLEINMRRSMGSLALALQQNHLHPSAQGELRIAYDARSGHIFHQSRQWQETHPAQFVAGRLQSGYFPLCPVGPESHFHASLFLD
jgi:hypothetical protein